MGDYYPIKLWINTKTWGTAIYYLAEYVPQDNNFRDKQL